LTLLSEIQAAAASDSATLSSILRKCQILAVRLKYEPFKEWVARESNGYPAGVELPEYRVMRGVPSKADFIGMAQQISNYPVPPNIVPDTKLQRLMAMMTLRESVAEYEALVEESKGHPGAGIKSPWPPGMAQKLLRMEGMQCIEAWQELPITSIAGMLSQIRNRLLAFTLEIEEADPDLGERSANDQERERVAATYQTVILGGTQTIVHGGTVEQHITVEQGDLAGLILALKDLGVPQADISSLTHAIEADRSEGKTYGNRAQSWIASAGKKVASGAWQLTVASAPQLIVAAVKQYAGLQ
jgi:hypothetical protein